MCYLFIYLYYYKAQERLFIPFSTINTIPQVLQLLGTGKALIGTIGSCRTNQHESSAAKFQCATLEVLEKVWYIIPLAEEEWWEVRCVQTAVL